MNGKLHVVEGDLFAQNVDAVVNAVNCVGVMGAGIALAFRRRFPAMFEAYRVACIRGDLRIGTVHRYDLGTSARPRFIINLPTKRHWADPSHLDDIQAGLDALGRQLDGSIRSIAMPALGCGLGGLALADVRPSLEAFSAAHRDVDVTLVLAPRGSAIR